MNWDKIKDIITIAIIPILGWVMITMRDIGTLQNRVDQQASAIMKLEAEVKSVSQRTQAMEVQSAKIETRLEALGAQLTRIERMLSVYETAK
jgi:septal ring factor EnvC (AmiA/AmiB activator)